METEFTSGELPGAQQDEHAVAAVRGGDAERYRELVERHERRVFAVAWSRLGDVALAEEATQEAFIRGFRRLWLLSDGAKFAGWIASVARNTAINLGLRHRRELKKRERWALEQTAAASADESVELCTPETLRQTLAEMPVAHRECLVLFYLEGKSGAEAAAALGISESALRVRLHRARAAMRERLEKKLEGSLAQLRPAKSLVPLIMAGVLAASSSKAAAGTVGAAVAGALAKVGSTKWLLPVASFFSFLFFLPMVVVGGLSARMELKNFRDQKGFRARLFRTGIGRRMGTVVAVMFAVVIVAPWLRSGGSILPHTFSHPFFLLLLVFNFIFLLFAARQLVINRNPYFIAQVWGSLFVGIGCLLVGLSLVPVQAIFVFIIGQSLLTLPFLGQRPIRMDYNLFLRATEGLLRGGAEELPAAQCGKSELLGFARFLGSRWLVDKYRWVEDGLQLRLALTGCSSWLGLTDLVFNRSWKHRSQIQLAGDGKVSAQLCEADQQALSRFHGTTISKIEPEAQVAAAVAAAWRSFRASNVAAAELALGQQSDSDVFVTTPAKGGFAKVRWLMAIVLGLAMIAFLGIKLPGIRERLDGLKPVKVSAAEVRAFLNDSTPNPNPKQLRFNSPYSALLTCLVLPSTNWYSPEGLRAMQEQILLDSARPLQTNTEMKSSWLCNSPQARRAIVAGWLDWTDVDVTPRDVNEYIHRNPGANALQFKLEFLLTRKDTSSWVRGGEPITVARIDDYGLVQLRWLRGVDCLDLVDREALISQIASVQVLSGTPPGQPPIHDWRGIRGLFFTPRWPALRDTYFSIAALEILGGLDRIDREACIRRILRRHGGKGYFTAPDSGGYNEYRIDGSARDTFAAFESLRILGALDRVKDLEKWQFRVTSNRSSKRSADGVRNLLWEEVEAWVCQQRFERFLRERKENPNATPRSLLEP